MREISLLTVSAMLSNSLPEQHQPGWWPIGKLKQPASPSGQLLPSIQIHDMIGVTDRQKTTGAGAHIRLFSLAN